MSCIALPLAAPPRPAVNVDVGAPSVVPSSHANHAGASGEVDDCTHAAGRGRRRGLRIACSQSWWWCRRVPVFARTMTHRVMTMTTTRRASSKPSLAARWVNAKTRPMTRMKHTRVHSTLSHSLPLQPFAEVSGSGEPTTRPTPRPTTRLTP